MIPPCVLLGIDTGVSGRVRENRRGGIFTLKLNEFSYKDYGGVMMKYIGFFLISILGIFSNVLAASKGEESGPSYTPVRAAMAQLQEYVQETQKIEVIEDLAKFPPSELPDAMRILEEFLYEVDPSDNRLIEDCLFLLKMPRSFRKIKALLGSPPDYAKLRGMTWQEKLNMIEEAQQPYTYLVELPLPYPFTYCVLL